MAEQVFGLHAVRALLAHRPGAVQSLIVQSERHDEPLETLVATARAAQVPVSVRPRSELDRLTGGAAHQGVLASMLPASSFDEPALYASLDRSRGQRAALLLVLDCVQDPQNLGACLRTADATGVEAVIAPRDRAAGLTPAARKVAAGAAESVPFVQVTNLARCLRELKARGLWVVGADAEASSTPYAVDLTVPLALVLGAEGQGLRRLTREHCDLLVRLPLLGRVESLNVAVAAGSLLYEVLRQRLASTGQR